MILKNRPGMPYYNSCPWTLWVRKNRLRDFWKQCDLMKSKKNAGVKNWMET